MAPHATKKISKDFTEEKMGLSASMWTSVSGLLSHGDKMNVVGNNIANVSTIGFKSQRMDFNDYLYISGGSTSGPTQIGAGVANYAVLGDFSQGALQSTNSVTDIAIDGEGFFKVRQPNSQQMYYTRAGDFYFNADRQLQNPEGYRLQGWKVNTSTRLTFKSDSVNLGKNTENESAFVGTGTPKDIVLDSWYLEPQRTSSVKFTMGLTSDNENDLATSADNPMNALFNQWDARKNPPMPNEGFATQSSIKIYDEGGNPHTMTVYYDQVATKRDGYEITGLPAGYTMYEYLVTVPPEEDMRSFGGTNFDPETNTFKGNQPETFYQSDPDVCNKMAGVMMTGHLIFDAAGNLVNQTAYTYGGDAQLKPGDQYAGKPEDPASWQTTRFSSNGLPVFCANFTGQPLANSVNEMKAQDISQAQDYLVEIDFGLRNLGGKTDDWGGKKGKTLADLTVVNGKINYNEDVATFANAERMDDATSAGTSSFIVQDGNQNGFASGVLSGTNITNDGVVYGYYDNGETIPLYQIALYDFHNKQGLRREGGNLYAQTKESGEPRQGVAGDNGFGVTRAYNIEGSNVDISTEFVNMITTQRGFQANSKGVTTVDTMLETVIGMKR